MIQFTCSKAVTHPSTNRARCKATALIETNALPLHQTGCQGGGIERWWPSSVCLSVCLSRTWSRTERHRKLTIKAHDTYDPWPHLEIERSKVKEGHKPLKTAAENQPYLRKGKAYVLQALCTDGIRWPASCACAVTSMLLVAIRATACMWRGIL